jgi:hypothetical protein
LPQTLGCYRHTISLVISLPTFGCVLINKLQQRRGGSGGGGGGDGRYACSFKTIIFNYMKLAHDLSFYFLPTTIVCSEQNHHLQSHAPRYFARNFLVRTLESRIARSKDAGAAIISNTAREGDMLHCCCVGKDACGESSIKALAPSSQTCAAAV